MEKLPLDMKLFEIRVKSFYNKGNLISEIIVLYFKFSNNLWYEIISCDGLSTIKRINEPEVNINKENSDSFYYPIKKISKFNLNNFGKLKKINEYLWNGKGDESCGFVFEFDNDKYLSIIEDDSNIEIYSFYKKLDQCIFKEKLYLD